MKKMIVLIVMYLAIFSGVANAQEQIWKLDTKGKINAFVGAFARNYDINSGEMDYYTAQQIYIKYGDEFVIRPFLSWWGNKYKSPYEQCSGDECIGTKNLGVYPIKVNEEWIKFEVSCKCEEKSTFIYFVPQTLLDANKLHKVFIKSNVVSFIDSDISAKGYTKTHNELKKIYGLDFK